MRVRIKRKNIASRTRRIEARLKQVPKRAYDFFKKKTPIDTGNARLKTRLLNTVIHARYPYAARLDSGYSKQAPIGMSVPTIAYIKSIVKRIMTGR